MTIVNWTSKSTVLLAFIVAAIVATGPRPCHGLSSIAPSSKSTARSTLEFFNKNNNNNNTEFKNRQRHYDSSSFSVTALARRGRDPFMEAQILTGLARIALEGAGLAPATTVKTPTHPDEDNNDDYDNQGRSKLPQTRHPKTSDTTTTTTTTITSTITSTPVDEPLLRLVTVVSRVFDWPCINTGEVWIQLLLIGVAATMEVVRSLSPSP